jgi:hypothetical protein
MKKHQQTTLTIRGKTISVDVGVRELILQLNALPGVETYYSCQGHRGQPTAYVYFGGPGALKLLLPLAQMILSEEWVWSARRQCHVCRGCYGRLMTLEICGTGIVLRWNPKHYRRVLAMAAGLEKLA